MKRETFDDVVAQVVGLTAKGDEVEFSLSIKEIKHIRRTLRAYEHIHPSIDENELNDNKVLLEKFLKFGRRGRRVNGQINMKNIRNSLPQKCVNCSQTSQNFLTLDHIVPISQGGSLTERNNLQILCYKCHNIKNLQVRIDRKLEEIESLKSKIRSAPKQKIIQDGW